MNLRVINLIRPTARVQATHIIHVAASVVNSIIALIAYVELSVFCVTATVRLAVIGGCLLKPKPQSSKCSHITLPIYPMHCYHRYSSAIMQQLYSVNNRSNFILLFGVQAYIYSTTVSHSVPLLDLSRNCHALVIKLLKRY